MTDKKGGIEMRGKGLWVLGLALSLLMVACDSDVSTDRKPNPVPAGADVYQDEKGIISAEVGDDGVFLIIDPEKWEVWGENSWDELLPDGIDPKTIRLKVNDLSGPVRQIAIGEITGMVGSGAYGYEEPVVVFLLEDGRLEYTMPYPQLFLDVDQYGADDIIYSFGEIEGLEKIENLVTDFISDGMGDQWTIIAIDQNKAEYDLKYPLNLSRTLTYTTWHCPLRSGNGYNAYMEFYEDGTVTLQKGRPYEHIDYIYEGTYTKNLASGNKDGKNPGSIDIDLKLVTTTEWAEANYGSPAERIRGTYDVGFDGFAPPDLYLYRTAGDPLHFLGEEAMDIYDFYNVYSYDEDYMLDYTEFDAESLSDYLIGISPEVEARVIGDGMALLVTDEISDIEGWGRLRDVWLGTNHENQFVRETLYSISSNGSVLEYDPVKDDWNILWGNAYG